MREKLVRFVAVILLFTVASITFGQDDENIDLILTAFDKLTDGYHYLAETTTTQSFIEEDEQTDITTIQSADGIVDANNNYYVQRSFIVEAVDAPDDAPPFILEQLQLDDILHLQFGEESGIYTQIFPQIPEGWARYDDLADTMEEGTVEQLTLENLVMVSHPSDTILTQNIIKSVTELDSETLDGIDMRVFEIEVDGFQVYLRLNENTLEGVLDLLVQGSDFFDESEFTVIYTVWIGAEDGLLYQGKSEGYTLLPYLTADVVPGPPYDIGIAFTTEYTIDSHGEAEPIEDIAEQVGIEPAP